MVLYPLDGWDDVMVFESLLTTSRAIRLVPSKPLAPIWMYSLIDDAR